jgi:transcriptional regulator with XRE-family HTH domain
MPSRDKTAPAPPTTHRGDRQIEPPGRLARTTEMTDDHIRPKNPGHERPVLAQAASDASITHSASPTQRASQPERVADRLRALRRRTGMSAAELAKAAGMPATTYKSYEDRFAKPHLPAELALRLAPILAGRGNPPLHEADILELATPLAIPHRVAQITTTLPNARRTQDAPAPTAGSRDVPLLAVRAAGWGAITLMPDAPPLDYLPRPPALAARRTIFAFTIADNSLSPRFEAGERVYCDPNRPPAAGGYAVALLRRASDQDPQDAHIGRLVAMDADTLRLRLLQPEQEIALDMAAVERVGRILTTEEMLG